MGMAAWQQWWNIHILVNKTVSELMDNPVSCKSFVTSLSRTTEREGRTVHTLVSLFFPAKTKTKLQSRCRKLNQMRDMDVIYRKKRLGAIHKWHLQNFWIFRSPYPLSAFTQPALLYPLFPDPRSHLSVDIIYGWPVITEGTEILEGCLFQTSIYTATVMPTARDANAISSH